MALKFEIDIRILSLKTFKKINFLFEYEILRKFNFSHNRIFFYLSRTNIYNRQSIYKKHNK